MTDREYLELAYRAYAPGENYIRMVNVAGVDYWNPITDDGDALRLAVKLRMVVDTDYNGGANAGNAAVDFGEPEYGYQEGQGKTDHFAATRRAIVRAAAEIGRSMK